MSEEKLYIDDGELVYYINENEFIACDEIPMPMLEGIKDLQQKVEQLEKENIKQKEIIENLTTMTVCGDKKQIKNTAQYKLEQLENENEYLKMSNPEQNMEHFRIVNENKRKIDMLRKENHQLEKEVNKYQKELEKADSITQSCIFQGKQESKISFRKCLNRLEQLENIRKEVIEYIKDNACYSEGHCKCSFSQMALDNLLNILNKGENNE